jgi:hypothetical protein
MEQQKRGFMDRPVRLIWLVRIVIVLIVAALVILGLQAWGMSRLRGEARDAVREQIRLKGEAVAETLAVTAREDILTKHYDGLQRYFADLVRQPDITYLVVMTPDGRAVVHTDAKLRGVLLIDKLSGHAIGATELLVQQEPEKSAYDVAVPVMGFTRMEAVVRVGVSYTSADEMFR